MYVFVLLTYGDKKLKPLTGLCAVATVCTVCVYVCVFRRIISGAHQNMLNLLNHEVMDYRFINEDKRAADISEELAKQRFTMTPDVGRFHSFCDRCNEAM